MLPRLVCDVYIGGKSSAPYIEDEWALWHLHLAGHVLITQNEQHKKALRQLILDVLSY